MGKALTLSAKASILLIRHSMAQEIQYTANTGIILVSTANSNLDGTGTLVTVLTAAGSGTLVKSITVKAVQNTTEGMVRLFITNGGSTRLISEVHVPAVTKGANDPAFEAKLETNLSMDSGDVLKASTQNGENFHVIAEGLDWAYYTSSVRPESTKFSANTALAQISTANSELDGTGTIADVLTAASNGTEIASVIIKATGNTTAGMIRLYIYDGTNNRLLMEIPVEATTKSAKVHSFSRRITFNRSGFSLKATWKLRASTEKGETFNIIAEGLDWSYPA